MVRSVPQPYRGKKSVFTNGYLSLRIKITLTTKYGSRN